MGLCLSCLADAIEPYAVIRKKTIFRSQMNKSMTVNMK